jgi:hypothetical protein
MGRRRERGRRRGRRGGMLRVVERMEMPCQTRL